VSIDEIGGEKRNQVVPLHFPVDMFLTFQQLCWYEVDNGSQLSNIINIKDNNI
jgi:hypothetical protein